jgi:hypothetical protein
MFGLLLYHLCFCFAVLLFFLEHAGVAFDGVGAGVIWDTFLCYIFVFISDFVDFFLCPFSDCER